MTLHHKLTCLLLLIAGLAATAPAATTNTDGRATFNVTILRDGGNYAPAHVLAIWVTDDTGKWVKTLRRQAGNRANYLTQWNTARAGVTNVDGVTGATTSSYPPITEVWNCRYTNNAIVPDGYYKLWVEFTERNGQGPYTTNGLRFFKGTTSSTNIYPDYTYIKYMTNTYIPNLYHDLAIRGISPSMAQPDTLVSVQVAVTNKATYPEAFTVTLSNLTTATLLGSRNVTNMAANSLSNLVFTWNTAGVPIGAYNFQAMVSPVNLETNLADNVFISPINLVPTPHDLAVLEITPAEGFTNANTILRVLVTNETTTTESFFVVVSNLTSSSLIASQQVLNLPGFRGTNVAVNWATLGMNGGNYDVQATAGPANEELVTDDNTLRTTILLRQGTPDLAIHRINAPAHVLPNTTNAFPVTVTNKGDFPVASRMTLFDETDGRLIASYNLPTIQPRVGLNVNCTWRTTNSPYGYHILTAIINPVASEVEVADNTNRLAVPVATGWRTNTFVAKGSLWRYHDKGFNLGSTPWKQADYYDLAWSSSPGPLGYSIPTTQNTNMNYVMSYGTDADNKYPTYYLRQTFYADALATNLVLSVRRDDGVVLYLNGSEIARYNMPTGAVSYTTFASANITGDGQYHYYLTNAPAEAMVLGHNVLAAELHQNSASSADVVLDVEMLGPVPNFPTVHDVDAIALGVPGDVIAGDRMPVTITVTNTGSITETVLVVLKDTTTGQVIGSQTLSDLQPGIAGSVQVNWKTLGVATGAHNLQAYTVINHVTNLAGAFETTVNITGSGFGLNAVNASGAIGGRCAAVAASSSQLLVGAGASLEVWDRSNAANPVRSGLVRMPGLIEAIAVSESWAYVACGNAGVQFVNLSSPTQPLHQNSYSSSGNAYGVAVSGNHLYVADGVAGLRIIDISNPAQPSLAGVYYTEGPARAVAVSGTTAYLLDQHKGLLVLNVASPSNPTLAASYDGFDAGQALAVSGSYAYIVDGNNHLYVVNVSGAPSLAGSMILANLVGQSVALNGTSLYVGAGDAGLLVLNVANPAAPSLAGTIATPGQAAGLALAGSTLYLADGFAGFQVYNVATAFAPVLQNDFPTSVRASDVVLANDLAYVAAGESGFRIYNVGNPGAPALLSRFTQCTNARCVAVSPASGIAYVGDGQYGLKIVNVQNPAAPALLGIYSTAALSWMRNIACSGSVVLVSNGRKLQLLNLSNPASPSLLGSYDAPAFVYSIVLDNGKAYLACGNAGLVILGAPQAGPLTLLGSYDTPGHASGVSVSGNTAYVADGSSGWLVLNVANPSTPSLVSANAAQGPVVDVAVDGTLAALGSGENLAFTMDVTSPLTPVENRVFAPLVRSLRLAAQGQLVTVAEDEAGLAVLSNSSSDEDHDGIPDSWEQQIVDISKATNGPIQTISDVRPNDDFDGDGLSNYAEYVAGTSPTDPGSRFALVVPNAPSGGQITLRWSSLPGKIYTVYHSSNLAAGFTVAQDDIPATPPTNSITLPVSGGQKTFYMIGVR